jgi:ankyrin repeat protein
VGKCAIKRRIHGLEMYNSAKMGVFLREFQHQMDILKAKSGFMGAGWLRCMVAATMLGMLGGCRSHNAALMDAIEKQEVGNVNRLLDGGAQANVVPEGANSFPIEAAAKGGNPAIVKLLLDAGAHPDSARGSETPLWWAMLNGHQDAAVALVDGGAKVDGPMREEMMPFYFAVMHDYTDLVTKMVAHEADIHASGPQGSPLHEAAENGNLALVRLLVVTGAEINRINDLGETPIFLAVEQSNWEVAEWFASNGGNINATNKLGQTVLHELAAKEDSIAIQKVCGMKPDPDVQNLIGETPLHIAAAKGNIVAARVLIEYCGADLNIRDNHNLSPAGLAYREGQEEMVEFLTSRGGRLR